MKELIFVYLALLLMTIAGCRSTRTVYPNDAASADGVDGEMIHLETVDGRNYFADGFRVEAESIILSPPVSPEKSDFRSVADALELSNGSPLQIETTTGAVYQAWSTNLDGDSLRFMVNAQTSGQESEQAVASNREIRRIPVAVAVSEIDIVWNQTGRQLKSDFGAVVFPIASVKTIQKSEPNVAATVVVVAIGSLIALSGLAAIIGVPDNLVEDLE